MALSAAMLVTVNSGKKPFVRVTPPPSTRWRPCRRTTLIRVPDLTQSSTSMARPNLLLNYLAAGALLCLTGCQATASPGMVETSWPADGPITGRIHHLTGDGLVLQVGNEHVAIAANQTRFAVDPGRGSASVEVERQPVGQMCVVDRLGGRGSDYNVSIYCETFVTRPVAVEVSGARVSTKTDRIFAPIRVGDGSQEVHGLIDTGSAGVVLNAFQVFPSTLLSKDGFHFPQGSHRIAYDGMIVTDVVIEKKYGGRGDTAHSSKGNLGFAQLSFGTNGKVVTGLVPVLFAYARGDEKGTRPFGIKDSSANIIGINADVNPLQDPDDDTGAKAAPRTPVVCDERVVTACGMASPLRKLAFASGIGQGFLLDRMSMSDCPIAQLHDCPLNRGLTIGLTEGLTRDFTRTYTRCRSGRIGNTGSLNACSQVINNVTIASNGYAFRSISIFDSGNPKTIINVPVGARFGNALPDDAVLRVSIGSDPVYGTRVSEMSPDKLTINQNMNIRSCVGIVFFEKHAYFMDYDNGMVGLR